MSDESRVHLGFHPAEHGSDLVFAIVKRSYRIAGSSLVTIAATAFRPPRVDRSYRNAFVYGTDFAIEKLATDVIAIGSAFAPRSTQCRELVASVSVGGAHKRIRVVGDRTVVRENGSLVLGDPTPFESLPIRWENAYGGIDSRVPVDAPKSIRELAVQRVNGPGFYPRNPHGRGYFAIGVPCEGAVAPNLEDPEDALTLNRMCVATPQDWWRGPIPQCFMWVPPWMFPRIVHGRGDAWFPGPEDERMPEVQHGWLRSGYRTQRLPEHDRWFKQDASLGLTLTDVAPGTRVAIENMNSERSSLVFEVPALPVIEFEHRGRPTPARVRLHHIVARPNEQTVDFVYGAHTTLEKRYAPGLHAKIPVAVRVDRGEPVAYHAPTPVRDVIARALAESSPPSGVPTILQMKDDA
jgi:hypothetical protein